MPCCFWLGGMIKAILYGFVIMPTEGAITLWGAAKHTRDMFTTGMMTLPEFAIRAVILVGLAGLLIFQIFLAVLGLLFMFDSLWRAIYGY